MTNTGGFIVQGNKKSNHLAVRVEIEANGDKLIYNVIKAGDGNDYLDAREQIVMDSGKIFGAKLYGEDGDDHIFDSQVKDTLSGGNGDDHIVYTAGGDVIDGGDGHDVITINFNRGLSSALSVTNVEQLNLSGVTLHITDFDLKQFDIIGNIEARPAALAFHQQADIEGILFKGHTWYFGGSDFDDIFDLSTSTTSFNIRGGDGNDTIHGGSRNDNLFGNAGDDLIFGGAGRDLITDFSQKGSTDTVHGGDDSDAIALFNGRGIVTGDGGNDTISLRNGTYTVDGGAGNDHIDLDIEKKLQSISLAGGAGDDHIQLNDVNSPKHANITLHGGSGMDKLQVSAEEDLSRMSIDGFETLALNFGGVKSGLANLTIGADTLGQFREMITLSGDNVVIKLSSGGSFAWHSKGPIPMLVTVCGSNETDSIDVTGSLSRWDISGGAGDDTITGGAVGGVLKGGAGDDILTGQGKGGNLMGGAGNDVLRGFGKEEHLNGGAGDDILFADAGLNLIYSGSGRDQLVFSEQTGGAIVYDFNRPDLGKDIIDLSHVTQIKNFADLMAHHVKMLDHNAALLIYYGDTEIALVGIKTHDLDRSDFIL